MKRFCLKHYIGDGVVSVVLALILVCVSVLYAMGEKDNTKVRILHNGSEIATVDLSSDDTIFIDGVQISVSGGRAYIKSSDCPDKICMNMHGVDKNGGGAVCIPNRIVLEPISNNIASLSDAIAG